MNCKRLRRGLQKEIVLRCGKTMLQVDGFYLYSVGYSIHPLLSLRAGNKFEDWQIHFYIAQSSLEALLNRSVYQLKTSRATGVALLALLESFAAAPDRKEPLTAYEAYQVTTAATQFESVLAAEFGLMDIFLVIKKRGYDTSDLIVRGQVLFPDDLGTKVSEAIPDVVEGARCIAFALPTAAGFHLHRANESVLRHYYDAVTEGKPRPNSRNIGDYLNELDRLGAGDRKVKACLRDLKDLHRNPLIHPDDSLESVDEAIALLGSIQGVVVHMLKAIPEPELTVNAP